MKAVIELDVPEWQIGQDVSVYFPDTMVKHGKCELLKEQEAVVLCKDCKFSKPDWEEARWCELYDCRRYENWFCADGEPKDAE